MHIAKEYGTSQGPVREALRELEMLGFVRSEPHCGTYVRDPWQQGMLESMSYAACWRSSPARAADAEPAATTPTPCRPRSTRWRRRRRVPDGVGVDLRVAADRRAPEAIVAASVRVARSSTEPPAVRQFWRSLWISPASPGSAVWGRNGNPRRVESRCVWTSAKAGSSTPPPPSTTAARSALVRRRCGRRGRPRRSCRGPAHAATVEHPAAADPPPPGVFPLGKLL